MSDSDQAIRVIRDDLWRAVTDRKTNLPYVWDGKEARIQGPGDEGKPVLPKLTDQDMNELRKAFSAQNPSLNLALWERAKFAARALPRYLSRSWTIAFQTKVVDLLQQWFSDSEIEIPSDLFYVKSRIVSSAIETEKVEIDSFRNWIIACISQMDQKELESLPIPTSVAYQVTEQSRIRKFTH